MNVDAALFAVVKSRSILNVCREKWLSSSAIFILFLIAVQPIYIICLHRKVTKKGAWLA